MSARWLIVTGVVSAVVASSVGFAAALAITPLKLTIFTAASSVPISTCTLTTAADTYAYEAVLSAGTNFGTATTLHVRSGTLDNKRSFVRFDLSSCSIPANARLLTGSMKLFLSTAPSSNRTYQLHRVTQSWGETLLTWNNQPTVAGSVTGSVATGTTSNVTLEWNVLADVQAFVTGTATNHGWRVRDQSEGALSGVEGRFSSDEHATAGQRPSLVITYYP